MNVQFLEDGPNPTPKTVWSLVCPDPNGPYHPPVLVGTNARKFGHGQNTPNDRKSNGPVQSCQVCTQAPVEQKPPSGPVDDSVGQIRWAGPRPLKIPPDGVVFAACKVTTKESWE